MIIVDRSVGSYELQPLIQRQGIACDKGPLEAADACFEGYGPQGMTLVGVERKKVLEALDCIDTGRLGGFQLPKMRQMYGFRFIVIEGVWRPHTQLGTLQREVAQTNGAPFWTSDLPGGHRAAYHKLRRYLFSLTMAGAHVMLTRDVAHTAYDICELYQWFQKPWHTHTSMNTLYTGHSWDVQAKQSEELVMIPTVDRRPSLTRLWAAGIDGIGVQKSADAERVFTSPRELANADESDWMNVPGIGLKAASGIVKQIVKGRR